MLKTALINLKKNLNMVIQKTLESKIQARDDACQIRNIEEIQNLNLIY